jgi:hypothetical protein
VLEKKNMVVLTLMLLSMSLLAGAGILVVISAVLSLDTARLLWGSRKEGGRLGIIFLIGFIANMPFV